MTKTAISTWLQERGANHDVISWAGELGGDWSRFFDECPRGDWLLAIAAARGAKAGSIVRGACACARFALDYLPENELRPARAIEAAEAWLADPSLDLESAKRAAEQAIEEAVDPAAAASATAALSAASAVETPADAATAAACAVQAAAMDVGDCAMMPAMRYAQSACADLVRAELDRTDFVDFEGPARAAS